MTALRSVRVRRAMSLLEGRMNPAAFEDQLKSEGYVVSTSETIGPKVNPTHSHPFDVKALVLKGAITLTSDGKSQTFGPGEVFEMARKCEHFESYGPEGAVVLAGRRT